MAGFELEVVPIVATFESAGPRGEGDVNLSLLWPFSLVNDDAEPETDMALDGEDCRGCEMTEETDVEDFIEVVGGGTNGGAEFVDAEDVVVFEEEAFGAALGSEADVPDGMANSGGRTYGSLNDVVTIQ